VRRVGVLVTSALAASLCCGIASAASMPFGSVRHDLGSELMLRLFGETSDTSASFAAARGDRTSESPLRDLALNIPSAAGNSAAFSSTEIVPLTALRAPSTGAPETTNVTQAFDRSLMRNEAHFAAPFQSNDDVTVIPSSALLTANYQPVAPVAAISPAPGTLAFDSVPAATQSATLAPLTVHLGGAQFEGNVQGGSSDTPALSLHDSTYGAGANLQLRAGKRDINLNLTTQYEQLLRNDNSGFAAAVGSPSSWQLPGDDVPLVVPNYADLNRLSLAAGIAVPVVRGLTLNLNYGAERLYGGYGLPGLVNLDAVNNTYGGRLTFDIPDASKTLSISAYQERFSDSVLPTNGSTQTREDVNFTVKF
jgi:hypothetical protein